MKIQQQRNKLRVAEFDRNGIVTLENGLGEKQAHSEKIISSDPEILNQLEGRCLLNRL